jgi:Fe-S oxidoreductase
MVAAEAAPKEQSPVAPQEASGVVACQSHRAALDNCTFCPKLCRFACPVATATGNEANIPRQMMLATRLSVVRQRTLTPSVSRTLYSCVDCRGCRTFCDHDNDVSMTLQQARAELWNTDFVPPAVRRVCESLASSGAVPGSEPSALAGSLSKSEGEHTALFLGCQNDVASIPAARGAHALAQACYGATRLIDGGSQCCGHPLLRWGHKAAFIAHASRLAASLPRHLQRLVVDDPGCAYTLGTLYQDVANVAMPDVTWAADLLPAHAVASALGEHALHDACFATRWLKKPTLRETFVPQSCVPGSVLEGESGCCGGMLLPFYDLKTANSVASQRVTDLIGDSTRRIVSPSPTCSRRLRSVYASVDDLLAIWHRSLGTVAGEGANIV